MTLAPTSSETARPTRSLVLRLSFGHRYRDISFIMAQSAFRCSVADLSIVARGSADVGGGGGGFTFAVWASCAGDMGVVCLLVAVGGGGCVGVFWCCGLVVLCCC